MKNTATEFAKATQAASFYVASRASIPERGQMWRAFREQGYKIVSSWIDEDGEGATGNFTELWDRIQREIASADCLILYAEQSDFPLKGALIEVGMALAMNKPVIVSLPGVEVAERSCRPIGSWIAHRLVERNDDVKSILGNRSLIKNTVDQMSEESTAVQHERAAPNGYTWQYHHGRRIALSCGPTDALVATGDDEYSWLDISDENAQIVKDAFNRRASIDPTSLNAERVCEALNQAAHEYRTDWQLKYNDSRKLSPYLKSTVPFITTMNLLSAQIIAAWLLEHGRVK